MKATNIITRLVMGCVLALCLTTQTSAIEGLKLQIRCPHVVLSWPSTNDETYIVQYRATLDINSTWQTLTNFMPPATGTNMTYFVHSNRVDCPAGQIFGMMRMSGGDDESATMMKASSLSVAERIQIKQSREEARLAALYEKCKLEGREPTEWELKNQPPLPPSREEIRAKILAAKEKNAARLSGNAVLETALVVGKSSLESFEGSGGANGPQPEGAGGGGASEPSCGFYRVVRNGISLLGVTNSMVLSGVVTLPIEYSLTSTDELTGFSFYANGNPLVGVDLENTNGLRLLTWDTRMLTNGIYNLGAEAGFVLDAAETNSLKQVTISNLVSFPNFFTRVYGDWMWVNAKLSIPVADVEIAMHDENGNYMGSFMESTTNGSISFIWDLTDGNGFTFADTSFRGDFYVSAPAGAGGSGSPAMTNVSGGSQNWCKEASWGNADKFVVAYSAADNNITKTYKIRSMVIGGIIGGEYGGVVSTLSFNGGGGYDLSPGNIYGSSAFELFDANSRTQLLSYLADPAYRNFYYFGHGHPRGIAGVTPATVIIDQDIVHTLKNYINSAKPTNGHPYRLVFIDGCANGRGTFCEGFGIPAQVKDRQYFIDASVRTRAYVSFKGDVPFNQAKWIDRSQQLNYFFNDWNQNKPLHVCVSNAVNGTYSQSEKFPDSMIIYGATNLQKDLY